MFTLVYMLLTAALFLSACGGTGAPETKQDAGQTVLTEPKNQGAAQQEGKAVSQKSDLFWNAFEKVREGDYLYIGNAGSFHDGVAWITVIEKESPGSLYFYARKTMLINRQGQVLYSFPQVNGKDAAVQFAGGPKTSVFSNHVSLVTTEEDQLLINDQGQEIWAVSREGAAEANRIFGEGSAEKITLSGCVEFYDDLKNAKPFNGYTVVRMEINTFDVTGNMYGILKPDGTWLMEPKDYAEGEIFDINLWPDRVYAEIQMRDDAGNYRYWAVHLETGEMCEIFDTNTPVEEYYHKLMDGSAESEQGFYMGTLLPMQWQAEADRARQNGLLYISRWMAFVDESWNVAVDLSSYKFSKSASDYFYPVFRDGYCYLSILNKDGAPYFTVLDESGQRVFPPVKFPEGKHWGNAVVRDGTITICEDFHPEESSACTYPWFYNNGYDLTGKSISMEGSLHTPYSEGLTAVRKISSSGELTPIHYMDVNGQDPFPQ